MHMCEHMPIYAHIYIYTHTYMLIYIRIHIYAYICTGEGTITINKTEM